MTRVINSEGRIIKVEVSDEDTVVADSVTFKFGDEDINACYIRAGYEGYDELIRARMFTRNRDIESNVNAIEVAIKLLCFYEKLLIKSGRKVKMGILLSSIDVSYNDVINIETPLDIKELENKKVYRGPFGEIAIVEDETIVREIEEYERVFEILKGVRKNFWDNGIFACGKQEDVKQGFKNYTESIEEYTTGKLFLSLLIKRAAVILVLKDGNMEFLEEKVLESDEVIDEGTVIEAIKEMFKRRSIYELLEAEFKINKFVECFELSEDIPLSIIDEALSEIVEMKKEYQKGFICAEMMKTGGSTKFEMKRMTMEVSDDYGFEIQRFGFKLLKEDVYFYIHKFEDRDWEFLSVFICGNGERMIPADADALRKAFVKHYI